MADAVAIEAGVSGAEPPVDGSARATRAERLVMIALMLLPGALIVLMGFNAGGYFPATPAVGALLVTQVLLVRIMQSRHPFEGLARSTLVVIAALAGYAALTLLSERWSHSPGRALIEFDRAWLYLVILVLFATVRASGENLRWLVRGLVLGISIVCLAGLISRVLPDVWHTAPDVSNQRLSYPVTYWNALGLLAALGMVLAFHLTCTLGERRFARILAAAVLPLLTVTLFFTFSRGAIAAGAIGLVVYAIAGHPRALLSGAAATVPATAVVIVVAYHANLLDTVHPTTPAAVSQGHRVALVAGVCAAVCAALRLLFAARLDPRLRARAGRPLMSPGARRGALAGALAAAAVMILALGLPHTVANDWNRFTSGTTPTGEHGDFRLRLTDPSNNGRSDLWRVALRGFSASPVHGYGAGMYQTIWSQRRPRAVHTLNAHSLYLQAMAELGIPGVALLAALVGTVLVGLATRTRGPRGSLYGALLAAAVVWALCAGVDWVWEMPVVGIGFFAAAGLALSPRRNAPPGWIPSANTRIVLGLICLATAALPVLIIGSQRRLDDAEHALQASNCGKANSAALSSIGWLSVRAQPYEIVGFCDVSRGLPRLGVSAMRQAVRLDPGSWETHYLLALAQASAGIDPRSAARAALRMNPREHLAREAVRQLRTSSPTEWVRGAAIVRAATLERNDLSIFPS